jgi:hypothetical protein
MSHKILTEEGIDKVRPLLRSRDMITKLDAFTAVVGRGELIPESAVRTLSLSISERCKKLERSKSPLEELDRECFPLVHEYMRDYPDAASDMRFWTRLAIVELNPVIYKRFPSKKSAANPEGLMNLDNFGIGARGECWPYKLWVRGELARDDSNPSDPYKIGRSGSIDLWTSHVHRQQLMSIRPFFRSVMNLQYPAHLKGKPLLIEGAEPTGKPGFRTLMKRLRENWASVEYSYLNQAEATALVKSHSKGLYLADGKSFLR